MRHGAKREHYQLVIPTGQSLVLRSRDALPFHEGISRLVAMANWVHTCQWQTVRMKRNQTKIMLGISGAYLLASRLIGPVQYCQSMQSSPALSREFSKRELQKRRRIPAPLLLEVRQTMETSCLNRKIDIFAKYCRWGHFRNCYDSYVDQGCLAQQRFSAHVGSVCWWILAILDSEDEITGS